MENKVLNREIFGFIISKTGEGDNGFRRKNAELFFKNNFNKGSTRESLEEIRILCHEKNKSGKKLLIN